MTLLAGGHTLTGAVAPPGSQPAVDLHTDLHGYIVARLDAHLAELAAVRAELGRSRPTPAGRRQAAAASAIAATRYADDIDRALNSCTQPAGTGLTPGGTGIDVR
jgi:hypothetical protein